MATECKSPNILKSSDNSILYIYKFSEQSGCVTPSEYKGTGVLAGLKGDDNYICPQPVGGGTDFQ